VLKHPESATTLEAIAAHGAKAFYRAMRRAYCDRAEYLGDPDFVSVPQQQLPHPFYAAGNRVAATLTLNNAFASGKRPLSSMSPTFLVDERGVAILVTAASDPRGHGQIMLPPSKK
jgi:gamma-glutamyltranspeptidase